MKINVFTQLHSKKYIFPNVASGTIWPIGKTALNRTAPNHIANDERGLDSEAEGVRGVERK
jgi:hypothetical protein